MLGCGWEEDSLMHYSCCGLYWKLVSSQRPVGLGFTSSIRGREAFFMLHEELTVEDTVRLALGMYALHRAVSHCRSNLGTNFNITTLLRIWTRRAAENSGAAQLLRR